MHPLKVILQSPVLALAAALAAIGLAGCASTPAPAPAADARLLRDDDFQPRPEPARDIFALTPAMRDFLDGEVKRSTQSWGKVEGLINALYSGGKLLLEYESSRTRDAAEAFEDRAGNCLSLAIMTAAFAREMRLAIQYHEVLSDTLWMQDRDFIVAANHVNLTLGRRDLDKKVIGGHNSELIIDFLPRQQLLGQRARPVTEARIVAMYHNNRAAELIVEHDWRGAYWHARDAIAADPSYAAPYNSLGVIYQRRSQPRLAEAAFRETLRLEADNSRALANLAALLGETGRGAEAAVVTAELKRVQPEPPFHHFRLAKAALARGEYSQARDGFREALRRNGQYAEIHLGLAAAYLGLGDTRRAKAELEQALEKGTTAHDLQRYSAKRDWLNRQSVQ
ncbi:MAG: tetratricopeptide repeat protein [Betaproteobacteria bacterium]|nr:tetratricopeptide repeat protein [Betaproteobacteria bacterium]